MKSPRHHGMQQLVLLLCAVLSLSASGVSRNHMRRQRSLYLGDSLFGLELESEDPSSVNLVIPGEDTDNRYEYTSVGNNYKATKSSKSPKSTKSKGCCGKGKGSKSSKGGSLHEVCDCGPGPTATGYPGNNGDGTGYPGVTGDGTGYPGNNGGGTDYPSNTGGGTDYPGDTGDGTGYPGDNSGGENGDDNGDGTAYPGDNGGENGDGSSVGVNGNVTNGDGVNGNVTNGDGVNGNVTNGDGVDGNVTNGDGVDGNVTNGDGVNGNVTNGDGGDGSYNPAAGNIINCTALELETLPTMGMRVDLNGMLDVVYYDGAVGKEKVLEFVGEVMNNVVRLYMAGCTEGLRAIEVVNATIYNIVMSDTKESEARGACSTDIEGAVCMKTDTPTIVYHGQGNTLYIAPLLNSAIDWAVKEGEFSGLSGLISVRSPDGTVYEEPPPTTINKATAAEDNGLKTAGKVIIPVAAVTLFLLAILFLRRRHRETSTQVKGATADDSLLDYETDEESTANAPRPPLFVNEESSLSSGGPIDGTEDSYYNENSMLGKGHAAMDVHVCQSSLCEACEQGSKGISFIKTGAPPSPERLPRDASRDYSASDTVSL